MLSRGVKRELTDMSRGKSVFNGLWNGFGNASLAAGVATNPVTALKYAAATEGINHIPYLFGSDRTFGDILADNTSWMTRDAGNTVVPLAAGIYAGSTLFNG